MFSCSVVVHKKFLNKRSRPLVSPDGAFERHEDGGLDLVEPPQRGNAVYTSQVGSHRLPIVRTAAVSADVDFRPRLDPSVAAVRDPTRRKACSGKLAANAACDPPLGVSPPAAMAIMSPIFCGLASPLSRER